jgi:hypothetical protein
MLKYWLYFPSVEEQEMPSEEIAPVLDNRMEWE